MHEHMGEIKQAKRKKVITMKPYECEMVSGGR
jgi:hypothetical protein